MKKKLTVLIALISYSFIISQEKNNEANDSIQHLKEVVVSGNMILGSKFEAKNRTGSAHFISPAELKKFGYSDINRMLKGVPGINFYEEDGFGLRPNISLRGTSPQRTSKISLMEDGVLIAPAPYSAPAAYYFPSVARMSAIEILKGSSQIQYGPFTTGGAINMVSTQIPNKFSGFLKAEYGSFNTVNIHTHIGDRKKNFGYLVEYLNNSSDGFKKLGNYNTGYDKDDFLAKFYLNTNPEATIGQALEIKFQYTDEISDETYLGLTNQDFKATPFKRYAASQKDRMDADHIQIMATYALKFSNFFRITTIGYYNGFNRNWYKLNDLVTAQGKKSIGAILTNTTELSEYFDLITGKTSTNNNALLVKANNRAYTSKGMQTKLDYHWGNTNTYHDIEIGLRYHFDEEDRFQWVDSYSITNSIMNLTKKGIPGTDANRISSANAFSTYMIYKLKWNNLTLTPGVRYENITLSRNDYGKNDADRTGSALSTRKNKIDIFIPGIGFNYNFSNKISAFGGIHKGFAPPSNQPNEKAEESINYELGSRFNAFGLNGEVVGFYNNYSNLLGSDLAATGGTGTLEQFNAGKVDVKGLEVLLTYDILQNLENFSLPITFAYTLTHTKFNTSFNSAIWGEVKSGYEIPYIPKYQFNVGIALEHEKFELNLGGRYNGEFRTVAGIGSILENEKIDSNFIIDISGKYHITKNLSITARGINVLDKTYAVTRVPAGLRPGHPFGVYGGINASL